MPEDEKLTLSMGQRHAYLVVEDNTLCLQSMNSNTFVNGQKIEKNMQVITNNTEVKMGNIHFSFYNGNE
ncbi:FHA domain-containing protein [Candidatus Uabimicrobium sp. HlEnr_7]|uniref:FHA domain-containing protein n=1 Tax=Candidatus Uabimicrobium helgolandensis TaxID=3095367 RepID=UPI003557EBF8